MVTRSRRSERNKYMCAIDTVVGYVGRSNCATFQRRQNQRYGKGKIGKRKRGRGIGRVDRNKSGDVTEDKARRTVRAAAL